MKLKRSVLKIDGEPTLNDQERFVQSLDENASDMALSS